MSLGDHLRELRNRITISAIAIILGGVLGWIYYNQVINALTKPLRELQVGREGVVNINFVCRAFKQRQGAVTDHRRRHEIRFS